MNKLAIAPTAAPGLPNQTHPQPPAVAAAPAETHPQPRAVAPAPAEPATRAPLTRHYDLVEDIDYHLRTGRSRRILVARWIG